MFGHFDDFAQLFDDSKIGVGGGRIGQFRVHFYFQYGKIGFCEDEVWYFTFYPSNF